ncbi:uncharacterized protein LOC135303644 isoform X2 [Passer domesticus]|uniref:uncharacterized protein LOC135303644 isoform X2 n=1 Tax=Passer domesticus TaxID=48849 RepID=UPI0030FE100B
MVGGDRAMASPEGAGGVPGVPACPTAMWPCLLLALALLGTVPASHPAPRQPQGVPAGDTTPQHYAVVKKLRTYSGAQVRGQRVRGAPACQAVPVPRQHCREVPVGTGECVVPARARPTALLPGRVPGPAGLGAQRCPQPGAAETGTELPHHPGTLDWSCHQPQDGLWRSRFCFQLRPFICQY